MEYQYKRWMLLIVCLNLFTVHLFAQNKASWNGYLQTRISSNLESSDEMMIRRAKFWLKGPVPNMEHLSYKMQVVYRSAKDIPFVVQDAYARYQAGANSLKIGRMVPDFTLQWNQPDAVIPVTERGLAVNSLIHGDKSLARMIGASYQLAPGNSFHLGLGIFNGNQNPPGHNQEHASLYTLRSFQEFKAGRQIKLHIGGSLAYRRLHSQTLGKIFNENLKISGDDFRWGIETILNVAALDIQAEYLSAKINTQTAWGYYSTASYRLSDKIMPTVLLEKYVDNNTGTVDNTWAGIGFSYFFTQKTKILSDFRSAVSGGEKQNLLRIQLQIFFN